MVDVPGFEPGSPKATALQAAELAMLFNTSEVAGVVGFEPTIPESKSGASGLARRYPNKLVQVLISCFLVLPAIIQTRIDPLGGSGRFNYPACLSYKLAGSEGFEPSTVGLTGHRTYLMCLLPLMWSVMQGSNLRFSAPKADDIPLA